MASIREMAAEIGLDTTGQISILFDFFGFFAGKVPNDAGDSAPAQVSLLDQVKSLRTGIFFNFNRRRRPAASATRSS